tara:strand:- start:962 stop:3136 length:2175 start_codon:yes stop_codon:yes gene_type:complete
MTSKITEYSFNRQLLEKNVPSELQEIDQWVAWAMESRGSGQKPTKIPKNPKTLCNAKTTSTDTWGSFEEACAACEANPELDGIGFVFTDNDPYVGIDLDGVVDQETGELNQIATDFHTRLESYTELSPSGTGLHIIVRGHLPKSGSRKGQVEMYEKGRYFTFTGKAISPQNSIAANQESLCDLHKKYINPTDRHLTNSLGHGGIGISDDELQQLLQLPENAPVRKLLNGHRRNHKSASDADFAACAALRDLGASPSQTEKIMLQSKLRRGKFFKARGQSTYLQRTIDKAFEHRVKRASKLEALIQSMNQVYAVVPVGGKTAILREFKSEDGVIEPIFMDQTSFNLLTKNVPTNSKTTAANIWLASPHRRQYEKVVFAPEERIPPNHYNLWRGFAVQSTKGNCDPYLHFVLEVICSHDKAMYEYLINWLAFLVQKPNELPEVAIVLMGGQGTGKNTFIKPLLELMGPHAMETSSINQLVGQFNGHQADKTLVHANESTWGGNKQSEGALKALITEPFRAIERKGLDIQVMKNCVHLIVSSNEDWPVAAALDDRRFAFYEVSDKRQQNSTYFESIHQWLDSGGPSFLLDYLKNRDISDWHPRNRPKGALGARVRLTSACSVTQWWYQCLEDEALLGDATNPYSTDRFSDKCVYKSEVYEAYCNHVGSSRHRAQGNKFVQKLRKLCPSIEDKRPSSSDGKRPRQLCFPELDVARSEFTRVTRIPFDD